ncbi:hypothetical protein [Stenotrophomonas maltophilia]|uniref:hypothetical protein n=1 Tax=Stenotrophomonas maltophilia TaxID=40324 RepID=UPI0013D996C6|nr:hypothetical protein [Stenotrophomonas maltophilia]
MPDVKFSQLAAASAASVAAGAGLWTMAGHILGLQMEYVGPASIRVSSGSAWIPSLQRAVEVQSALTLSGLSLTANTWYHVFLYMNGAVPAIEAVIAVPAAPYSGTARAKTGDTTRRYIGSFRTNAAGAIFNFAQTGTTIAYKNAQANPPFRVLSQGTATSETSISLAAVVPSTSRLATVQIYNFTDTNMGTGTSDDSAVGPPSQPNDAVYLVRRDSTAMVPHPLDSSQTMTYWLTTTPVGSAYVDVFGYVYER